MDMDRVARESTVPTRPTAGPTQEKQPHPEDNNTDKTQGNRKGESGYISETLVAEDGAVVESRPSANSSVAKDRAALVQPRFSNDSTSSLTKTASNSVSILFPDPRNKVNENKRRHSVAITHNQATAQQRWDHFVRLGAQTKTMMEDVLFEANEGSKRMKRPALEAAPQPTPHRHGVDLARDQMVQIQQLQRQLEDAKRRETDLQASNLALREQNCVTETRLQQTSNALRIAGKNATNARAHADAAEATAATLSETLQNLQTVITETKRACTQLSQEQQQVTDIASRAEQKLLQKESELLRVKKEMESIRQSSILLEHARDDWKQQRKALEEKVNHFKEEYERVHQENSEQQAMESARKARADKVEADYRRAQSLLEESSSEQKNAKETIDKLRADIVAIEATNAQVHEQLSEQQAASRTDSEKASTALAKAQSEAQELRIQKESIEESLDRAKHENVNLEQAISKLKQRVIKAERELKEQIATVGTNTATTPVQRVSPMQQTPAPLALFSLPPLSSGIKGKENPVNKDALRTGKVCCICLKEASGMMKTCKCGACQKRAHSLCVKQIAAPPSLSHPGTPAPPLPTILCKLGLSKRN